MARLKGWKGSGKSTAIKTGLSVYVNRGALVASSWPKKRGRPKSAITREQNEWFRQANLLAKYATGDDQWMAIEISRGSPWYPRDILISAMAGRLFETLNIDGVEFRSMAVNEDVSSDLDFLAGTVPGTIIVKGNGLWRAFVPGPSGAVLTSTGPGAEPEYTVNPGGSSLAYASVVPSASFSGLAAATKGAAFKPQFRTGIHAIGTRINATSGHVYRGSIFEITSAGEILALIAETDDVTAPATAPLNIHEPIFPPVILTSDKAYALVWTRRDGSDAFGLPIANESGQLPFMGLPVQDFALTAAGRERVILAKAAPAVGDMFTISSGGIYFVNAVIAL